ncbi:MAG: hypothetical protein LH614_11650 [Pyrinomonadaceae bacterium]|nr:hypothetical protein [Pyrinomonadaceae bacterium]
MLSALKEWLLFFVFFIVLPPFYAIAFIKIVARILEIESTTTKILIVLGMICLLPIFIYIHLVIMYAAGGGH